MNARDIIVLGLLQDTDPPGGPQEHPTSDIGQTRWHLAVLAWWRPELLRRRSYGRSAAARAEAWPPRWVSGHDTTHELESR